MKKTNQIALSFAVLLGISHFSYASLQDCLDAGQNENYQAAIKACKPYADSSMGAKGILAGSYGKAHEYNKAIKYAQMYIDQYKAGDDKIMLNTAYTLIGNYYYFGKGVSKNTQKGLKYITKGAELGNTTAQSQLGRFYGSNNAEGVTKNFPIAYQWTTIASINGDSDAKSQNYVYQNLDAFKQKLPYCIALGQDNVGQAYYQGIGGLDQSDSKGLAWMQKAAETDPSVSQVNLDLAKMYHINGDGDQAFHYAQKATSEPLAQAMQYLGTLYQQGAGTDKDPVKAYAYLTLAVDLYNNPDTDYWEKYAAPCRPNYQGRTDKFNKETAQQQLDQIDLNDKQKEQADKLIKEVKSKFKQ